jgi:para-aminobenzoate synthetase component I
MIVDSHSINTIRNNLEIMANNYDHVFWLDSCNQANPYGIGEYALLVGLGAKSELELTPIDFSWGAVQEFIQSTEWRFFGLSYELKSKTNQLESSNPSPFTWPLLSMVEPEIVVAIKRTGEIQLSGISLVTLTHPLSIEVPTDTSVTYDDIKSSMTKAEHQEKVLQIKKEIAAGNMYEMNLCMSHELDNFHCNNPFQLYQQLIHASPTPFSSYVKLKEKHVLCASPERYLSVQENTLFAQPIKGTSKRFQDENKDAVSRLHLANSIKERAEHIMIVDLVRNDLSKLCVAGSVRVEELFGIYGYKHVNQMISTISGQLSDSFNFVDTLMATYPMGSMTGAPKYIVLKFIEALETSARGWYSGSIGYMEPNGNMDSNVVIRTLLYDGKQQSASYSVGGAITFDSDPEQEYEECLLKSKAIRLLLDANLR